MALALRDGMTAFFSGFNRYPRSATKAGDNLSTSAKNSWVGESSSSITLRKSNGSDFEVMPSANAPANMVTEKAQELAGYIREIREKLHKLDKRNPKTAAVLSVQEAQALLSIGSRGRMTMSEIAECLHLSLSSMTAVVDKLEKKDFVARARKADDRRVVQVALTRAGSKFYKLVREAHVQFMEKFLGALDTAEQDTLLTLFRKITAKLT